MANTGAVEQIKERLSIVDVVGERVSLARAGRNLKGLCPFHAEKTPSFYVFPDQNSFHCFGCGVGGDVFTFVQRTENVDFAESLRLLAGRVGIELPSRAARRDVDERRTRLVAVVSAAASYFQSMLYTASGAAALAYLEGRGVTRSAMESFQLGWAPESWDALLTHLGGQGYGVEEIAEAGLAVARESGGYYDRFRGRIMFPIRESGGDVIAFGGRAIGDAQPKYLNSNDSPIFSKGSTLYALDAARGAIRRDGVAVVVEGYMDALIAHQAGITNVVAALGTALSEEHLHVLKRLAPRVVLALDADAAGDAAALRVVEVLRATFGKVALPVADRRGLVRLRYDQILDIRVARLPIGEDPDDVIRRSPEAFRALVAEAPAILDVLIEAEVAGAGDDPAARSRAADNVLEVLKDLPNPVLADQFTRRLADRLSVHDDALRARLQDLRRAARRTTAARAAPAAAGDPAPARRDWLTFEEFLLRMMLVWPPAAEQLVGEIAPEDIFRADARAVLEAIVARVNAAGAGSLATLAGDLDGPLAEYVEWIVGWGSDLPGPVEAALDLEIRSAVSRLRLLNLRREIALLAVFRRDRDREGDLAGWAEQSARIGAVTAEIRSIERLTGQRHFNVYWAGLFQEEGKLSGAAARSPAPEGVPVTAAG